MRCPTRSIGPRWPARASPFRNGSPARARRSSTPIRKTSPASRCTTRSYRNITRMIIGGIQNELAAMKTVQAPLEETVEVAMYQEWINQNFNNDCIDGTGIVCVQYADDGTLSSASIVAPLG